MSEIDFTTALGRLLRDPAERVAFAENPGRVAAEFSVRAADRAPFLRLVPGELEAQAQVLLRKRYRAAARFLPATCAALGLDDWPLFREHARSGWPASASADALEFCTWLGRQGRKVFAAELNRLRFQASGGRFAVSVVPRRSGGMLPGLQILLRRKERVVETTLRFGWHAC